MSAAARLAVLLSMMLTAVTSVALLLFLEWSATLLVPIVATAVATPALVERRGTPWARGAWCLAAALLLLAFMVVGSGSVGMLYAPALAALCVAAVAFHSSDAPTPPSPPPAIR